jgi:ketosteroid isomerase-like protein
LEKTNFHKLTIKRVCQKPGIAGIKTNNYSMNKLFFAAVAAVFYLTACNDQANQTAGYQKTIDSLNAVISADRSAEAAEIAKADSAWDKASEARSVEGWLSFYSDDAIMMPPGEAVCKDKASRETSIKNMFAIPGVSLRFQSTKIEVSRSGDLGYAAGVYQFSSKDAKGNTLNETGKYCETWKKQTDGNWKCIVDIWNADMPAKN